MRNDFEKWMANKYEITTIASYASAINRNRSRVFASYYNTIT